jgi:succinyl-CoA synthetase alpha subunit
MAILVNDTAKVICQRFTGSPGTFRADATATDGPGMSVARGRW